MPRRSRRRSTRLPTSPPASTAITPLCTAISRGVWLGSGGRAGGGGLRRGLREARLSRDRSCLVEPARDRQITSERARTRVRESLAAAGELDPRFVPDE